jgi:1-acyl-sn-glycerol-3-phosphate acyltransferase
VGPTDSHTKGNGSTTRLEKARDKVYEFLDRTFSGVRIDGPELDLGKLRRSRVMVVSTHRSHLDYFIVGAYMSRVGMSSLRFAAGDNLTRLPLIGPRFRVLGAFPVERGSALKRSYVRDLCEQVTVMLRRGKSIIVFPEGGRSYSGYMLEARSGIIGAGVLTQARDPSKEVLFLPVSVCYERVPELPYFNMLRRGRSMRKPGNGALKRRIGSLLYFGSDIVAFAKLLALSRLGFRAGEVYIDHGEPISLSSMVNLQEAARPGARDDFSAYRGAMQTVGLKIQEQLQTLCRILPQHIMAAVLREKGACSAREAAEACGVLVAELRAKGRNLRSIGQMTSEDIVAAGVRQLSVLKGARLRRNMIRVGKPWIVQYCAAAIEDSRRGV